MWWILLGMGVGWAVGELPGAVIAGVLVWGLRQAEGANSKRAIAASARAAKSSAANQFGAVPAHSELDALRREVSDLSLRLESTERRLAALDGGQAALAPAPREESMEPELAAVTEAQAPAPLPVSEPPLAPATAEADRAADRPAQAQVRTPEPDMPVGPLDELGELVSRLTGGNTVVRVGVIVLLLGIGFLLKYAADQGVFPVEVRLVGAFALGSALVALGWKLRIGRHGYGVSLQGGGLGIIYLVTIAAFRLYGLIPAPVAFALLVSTVALEGVLALAQEALALAILATLSGFAAPILLSTGGGAHVVMFGWYAVLNAGVLAMAWRGRWRLLNLLGFVFTFGIATAWGVLKYSASEMVSSEAFLALFTLMYLVIPIRFARRSAAEGAEKVDATIVFGLPVAAFALQTNIIWSYEYGLAWSAFAMAAVWAASALYVHKTEPQLPISRTAYLAVAVAFATLTIPLAFSSAVTSAAWALEGAGLVWIGLRQNSRRWLVVGGALPFVAGVLLAVEPPQIGAGLPVLNAFQLGALLVSVGAGLCARLLSRAGQPGGRLLLAWAIGWWLLPAWADLESRVTLESDLAGYGLLCLVGTSAVLAGLGRVLKWSDASLASWLALPVMVVAAGGMAVELTHVMEGMLALAWPIGLLIWLAVLRIADDGELELGDVLHAVTAWLIAGLLAAELHYRGERYATDWGVLGVGLAVLATFAAIYGARGSSAWPIGLRPFAWRFLAPAGLAAALIGQALASSWLFAADGGLPYLPVLSPVDLLTLLAGVQIVAWLRSDAGAPARDAGTWWVLSLTSMVVVTSIVARTIHHFAAVPWDPDAMFDSVTLQAALSLTWTVLALPIMTVASRREYRPAWVGGAALLVVVVLKLVVVDLARSGTLARIVSFVGVGLLLLVIGYLAPVPGAAAEGPERPPATGPDPDPDPDSDPGAAAADRADHAGGGS